MALTADRAIGIVELLAQIVETEKSNEIVDAALKQDPRLGSPAPVAGVLRDGPSDSGRAEVDLLYSTQHEPVARLTA